MINSSNKDNNFTDIFKDTFNISVGIDDNNRNLNGFELLGVILNLGKVGLSLLLKFLLPFLYHFV